MKNVLLFWIVAALFVLPAATQTTREVTIFGYVSCSLNNPAKGTTDTHVDSAQKCVDQGGKLVLIFDNQQRTIPIENPDSVQSHYAHRVAVDGYMEDQGFRVLRVRIL